MQYVIFCSLFYSLRKSLLAFWLSTVLSEELWLPSWLLICNKRYSHHFFFLNVVLDFIIFLWGQSFFKLSLYVTDSQRPHGRARKVNLKIVNSDCFRVWTFFCVFFAFPWTVPFVAQCGPTCMISTSELPFSKYVPSIAVFVPGGRRWTRLHPNWRYFPPFPQCRSYNRYVPSLVLQHGIYRLLPLRFT